VRALRIVVPLSIGGTLLATLFLFGVAYRFVTNEVIAPIDSSPSMAVDVNGNIHFSHSVSYRLYNSDYGLYTTSNSNGKWETVRITDNESVDATALAVDSDCRLHIAYAFDRDLSTVQPSVMVEGFIGYATNSSGEWRTQVVSHGLGIYRQCWMDMSQNGSPGILFIRNGTLMFAYVAEVTQYQFVVESLGIDSLDGDIAFDKDGVPNVSYVSNGTLWLATRASSGTWSSSIVYEGYASSIHTSLAYDRNGSARVAFFSNAGGKSLYCGNDSSGSWSFSRVSGITGSDPAFCALCLDANDSVRIGSSCGTDLVMYSEQNGNRWINRHLIGGDARPIQISVSPSGKVYIAFSYTAGKIEYLTDDATPVGVMSQVPYLLQIGIALVAIAGVFIATEVVRFARKRSDQTYSKSARWPPSGL
jgi:hypothetical protein